MWESGKQNKAAYTEKEQKCINWYSQLRVKMRMEDINNIDGKVG